MRTSIQDSLIGSSSYLFQTFFTSTYFDKKFSNINMIAILGIDFSITK